MAGSLRMVVEDSNSHQQELQVEDSTDVQEALVGDSQRSPWVVVALRGDRAFEGAVLLPEQL